MYNFKEVEKKWQNKWEKEETFKVTEDQNKKKYYMLVEFPYPSGAGLHVGHARCFTASDVQARYKRLKGYNVLFPFGFDSFGNPAEQYAIKNHEHPSIMTHKCIDVFRNQAKSLGLSVDWSREISTCEPEYYKWTQWQFIKFFNAGLAYKDEKEINWCPKCKMGLSNEDSQGGKCVRCDTPVEKKLKNQWMLKMSAASLGLRPDLYRPAAEVLIDAVGDGEHRAPFGRAAKRFKDTGLGLSIEVGRYLVQQQHGRVCRCGAGRRAGRWTEAATRPAKTSRPYTPYHSRSAGSGWRHPYRQASRRSLPSLR